jgi:PPOX class probable F420-dependent enzyme
MEIPDSVRELVESGPLAHLATINRDGSPQVTVIWIGIDGEHLVSGHMNESLKVRNARRDPRVVLSFDAPRTPGTFLAEHAVVRASATIEDGGAWSLLDRLAKVYVGPDFTFPAPESAGGFVLRYTIEHVGGVGPWVGS